LFKTDPKRASARSFFAQKRKGDLPGGRKEGNLRNVREGKAGNRRDIKKKKGIYNLGIRKSGRKKAAKIQASMRGREWGGGRKRLPKKNMVNKRAEKFTQTSPYSCSLKGG